MPVGIIFYRRFSVVSVNHSVAELVLTDQLILGEGDNSPERPKLAFVSEDDLVFLILLNFTLEGFLMTTLNTATIDAFENAMMDLAPKFVRIEENNQCFDSVRNTLPDFGYTAKGGNSRYSRKTNAAADYAAYVASMQ